MKPLTRLNGQFDCGPRCSTAEITEATTDAVAPHCEPFRCGPAAALAIGTSEHLTARGHRVADQPASSGSFIRCQDSRYEGAERAVGRPSFNHHTASSYSPLG